MKVGFSIYAGWVTSATVINISSLMKILGFAEPKYNEEKQAVIFLWIALAFYIAVTVYEGNPWFGAVFVWSILGIRNNSIKKEYSDVSKNCDRIALLHTTFIGAYIGY